MRFPCVGVREDKGQYSRQGRAPLSCHQEPHKGLAKNQAQLFTLLALGNLVLATRCQGRVDGASVF